MGTIFSFLRPEKGSTSYEESKPGRPFAVDTSVPGIIELSWTRPTLLYTNHRYQVRYRANVSEAWEYHSHHPIEEQTTISEDTQNTMDKTLFFPVETNLNANAMQSNLKDERFLNIIEPVFNTKNKQCTPEEPISSEKTIILIGAKGSGKRTFIDGVINYCLGVKWTDHYRFTVRNTDTNDNGDEWTTLYCINPLQGSKLNFKLNIIVTPSFENVDVEEFKVLVQQLQYLFETNTNGMKYVDAICYMVRAQTTQLYEPTSNSLRSLLTIIGSELEENTCTLATMADCKEPPVKQALDRAGINACTIFPFNNAGLFVSNKGAKSSTLSPLFWKIGTECYRLFFDKLSALPRKAALPLCPEPSDLSDTIEKLQCQLATDLDEIVLLRKEMKCLKDNEHEIEETVTVPYEIKTTRREKYNLSPGKHVTNCLNCYVTCHENCKIPKDRDKHGCSAMDKKTGYCKMCFEKCYWNAHSNTPFIYRYIEETTTLTFGEKQANYRRTPGEDMTFAKVLGRMEDHLMDLEMRVQKKMVKIRTNVNDLRRVSKRQDTMSENDHIDLLIRGEGKKKEPDFEERIEVLKTLLTKIPLQ